MGTQNVTVNLSGISFALDSKTQEQIVQEVTKSIIEIVENNLTALTNEIRQTLASLSLSAKYEVAPPAAATVAIPEEIKTSATVKEKTLIEEVKEPAAKPNDLEEKLNKDVTQFAGYQRFADIINELGFKTLYDLFVFKFTKTGASHFQEQTIIDEFLNVSRLKVFAGKAQVKKYILSQVQPKKAKKTVAGKPAEKIDTKPDAQVTPASRIDSFDISKTLIGFCRRYEVETIKDAMFYCNEVKLKALIVEGNVNKHSMIYQLVKFLCSIGFETKPFARFMKQVEGGVEKPEKPVKPLKTVKAKKVELPDADLPVYNQNAKEPETAEEKEMRSNRFYNLTETEIEALYTNLSDYPFAEYLQEQIFQKLKIKSVFELLFWFCGITRDHVAYQFDLDKAALLRMESILIDNGFIDPIDKLESMSYAYRSKYYHYIRYYRNKIINNKLYLNKYNKNLTEEEQDHLYMSVDDMGFSAETLNVIKYNKITNAISLIVFINYGCDTPYPKQFTQSVITEIEDVIESNGFRKYKYSNYIVGLRGYYYKSSMYIQKRKKEQAAAE
jgi:hypothetical protein